MSVHGQIKAELREELEADLKQFIREQVREELNRRERDAKPPMPRKAAEAKP